MSGNSQQILQDVLDQKRTEVAPELSEAEYFEVFCAEEILKDFDLSYDEIESGIVDGEHDGGIDSVYTFVNGALISEDFDHSTLKKNVQFDLFVIQSKTSKGFSEASVDKIISTTRKLLKLDADYAHFGELNYRVKENFDLFRQAYRALAAKFPSLRVHYLYAVKRADSNVSPNLEKKGDELRDSTLEYFPESTVSVQFLGAPELLALARRRKNTTFKLRFTKSLNDEIGYVVLSKLHEFNGFLRDEEGDVIEEIFESNVRDHQGKTEVNESIAQTLASETDVDFWMLNNGITILASRANIAGDVVTIESPQVVNGLQTSTQIVQYFDEVGGEDDRKVMVKIVSLEEEESRDKIIKSTNSQNSIQPASLRATDKIQRDIETVLKAEGLFYDRRKNFYKNTGKPASKIIGIPLMAQALMSLVLHKPDSARARPSTLIKKTEDYSKLFSESHPIKLYVVAAVLMKKVEAALKGRGDLNARDRNNIRFYVLQFLAGVATDNDSPTLEAISKIETAAVSDDAVERAIDMVWAAFSNDGASDQLAKGPAFKSTVAAKILSETTIRSIV